MKPKKIAPQRRPGPPLPPTPYTQDQIRSAIVQLQDRIELITACFDDAEIADYRQALEIAAWALGKQVTRDE